MLQIFQILLDQQVNTPKNWSSYGFQKQIIGNYALVIKKDCSILWDLQEGTVIPGNWISLHPVCDIGIQFVKKNNPGSSELCNIKDGKSFLQFDDNIFPDFSPYGPFATYALLQDYDDNEYHLKAGQKIKLPFYNTESGKCIFILEIPHVLGLFLADNKFASIDTVGQILIYDLSTGQLIRKLKGLGRRPLFVRTDRTGKKIFIYGVNWKKNEGIYKVWDIENLSLIIEKSGESIRFGHHITFLDGIHVIGDVAQLDTQSNTLYYFWLGMYYNSPHVTDLQPFGEWPYFAVIVCRDYQGIKNSLEIWDIIARKRLGSIELCTHADKVIPMRNNKIAILHSVGGKPIYDDKDEPALSIYSLHSMNVSEYPDQPEPRSCFFNLV